VIATRPATLDELERIHPDAVGTSYRAWACDLDGEPAGVIGFALTRPRACLFCGFDERLRPYLKSMPVLRLLKKVEVAMKERARPVYAIRDRNEPKAPQILARLGFQPFGEIEGEEVWSWQP
jgi:hypothetical protein